MERRAERELEKLLAPVERLVRALRRGDLPDLATLTPDAQGTLRADQVVADPVAQAIITWLRTLVTEQVAQDVARRLLVGVEAHGAASFTGWLDARSRAPIAMLQARTFEAGAMSAQMAQRTAAFAGYIQNINAQLADEVAEAVALTIGQGERAPLLADAIEQRLKVSKSRAKLIARDQVSKAQGAFVEERMRAAGISRYRWRTAGDERVRASHRALEGQVFSWNAPPSVGHPGHDINCRCVAIPVMDDEEPA
jgi:SPP1 gp7 family putative phage head morphogenesis protein